MKIFLCFSKELYRNYEITTGGEEVSMKQIWTFPSLSS